MCVGFNTSLWYIFLILQLSSPDGMTVVANLPTVNCSSIGDCKLKPCFCVSSVKHNNTETLTISAEGVMVANLSIYCKGGKVCIDVRDTDSGKAINTCAADNSNGTEGTRPTDLTTAVNPDQTSRVYWLTTVIVLAVALTVVLSGSLFLFIRIQKRKYEEKGSSSRLSSAFSTNEQTSISTRQPEASPTVPDNTESQPRETDLAPNNTEPSDTGYMFMRPGKLNTKTSKNLAKSTGDLQQGNKTGPFGNGPARKPSLFKKLFAKRDANSLIYDCITEREAKPPGGEHTYVNDHQADGYEKLLTNTRRPECYTELNSCPDLRQLKPSAKNRFEEMPSELDSYVVHDQNTTSKERCKGKKLPNQLSLSAPDIIVITDINKTPSEFGPDYVNTKSKATEVQNLIARFNQNVKH